MTEWKANTDALNKAIAQLAASKEARGIKQKGGKKYTVVADRVEALRQHLGDLVAIQTEIVHYSPKDKTHPIVVKACIYVWDATSPRLVATGFAEEWRDEGYVNATSALENCETSAIGRALANLGLHGGEYASFNEIEIAVAKRGFIEKAPEKSPEAKVEVKAPVEGEAPKGDPDGFDVAVPIKGWETMVAAMETFLPACETVEELKQFWEKNLTLINEVRETSPKDFDAIKAMVAARKAFLTKGKK